jgi:hypothetical protein
MKMKLLTRLSSLVAIAFFGLFLSNCKDDSSSTPKNKIELGKLSNEWTLVSAKLNGGSELVGAPTNEGGFNDVTLTISGTYSSAADATYDYVMGGTLPDPSPWPAPGMTNGEWSFTTGTGLIVRDPGSIDELSMVYSFIENGQLKITFTVDEAGWPGSKTSAVSGSWVFIFE